MSIIHVRQIETRLKLLFTDLIDLSDYTSKSQTEQNSAFLTRTLAAFSILATAGIRPDQAASTITDGYHDSGIDAIYFDGREGCDLQLI